MNPHLHTDSWGILPVLFRVGDRAVPAYPVFVLLGIAVGALVFFLQARRTDVATENTFYILLGALLGGTLGAKLPYFILNYRAIAAQWPDPTLLLAGRTIVGGLVGGALGVRIVKRRMKIEGRRGDLFVPAVAAGVAVGRIGCFLRGCCYGKPTALPWGVNFGDGVPRHPTQIYEAVFLLLFLAWCLAARPGRSIPGRLFRIFMAGYFGFRFLNEFVRQGTTIAAGLTVFQLAAVAIVVYYGWQLMRPPFRQEVAS